MEILAKIKEIEEKKEKQHTTELCVKENLICAHSKILNEDFQINPVLKIIVFNSHIKYTEAEVEYMKRLSPDEIREAHEIKKIFGGGEIVKTDDIFAADDFDKFRNQVREIIS